MGWIGWGLYAARRASRRRRRRFYSSTHWLTELINYYAAKSAQKQQQPQTPAKPKSRPKLVVPEGFEAQPSWEWSESDLDYYRYATEAWKAYTFEHWGVIELPAGKDAGNIFFSILKVHEEDGRGSLAHGAGTAGTIDERLPVLLLFRITDGYNDAFAAVQSWDLVTQLIEQDRPVREAGKYPRATLQR
jgi:hypothetical protein